MKRLLILPIISLIGAAGFCTGLFSTADQSDSTFAASRSDNTVLSTNMQVEEVLDNFTTEEPTLPTTVTVPESVPEVSEPARETEQYPSIDVSFTTPKWLQSLPLVPEIEEPDAPATTAPAVTTPPVTTTKAPVTTTKAPVTTTKAPVTTTKAPVTTTKAPVTTQAPTTTTAKPPVADTPTTDASSLSKFLAIVKGEIGVKEKSYNNVKYNTWYYGTAVSAPNNSSSQYAWCAVFISWCADQAGIPQSVIPKNAGSNYYYNWFKARGQFYKYSAVTPEPGDIIFIDWGKQHGGVDHVGVVISVENGIVTTVEGNYSNKVSCNTYSLSSGYIVGYGRPNYN